MTAAEKPAGRRSVDWEAIEPHYRAGVRSLKDIGAEFGVSPPAILKHAEKYGWVRDLNARVQAKADALVNARMVNAQVNAKNKLTERLTVEATAQAIADVRIAHRADIGRGRDLVRKLLAELETQTDGLPTFEALLEALADEPEDEKGAADRRKRLFEQWQRAMSLPGRVETMRRLADTLRILIDKEREAFGIGGANGGGGQGQGGSRPFGDVPTEDLRAALETLLRGDAK